MSPEAKEDKPWQWNRMTTSAGCARQPRARQPRGTQNTIESIVTSWKQWNQTQMKTSLGSETVRQQVQDVRGSRAEHKILLNLLCQSKSNEPRCKWRQALAVKPYDNKYRMCAAAARAAAARNTKYYWIYCDNLKESKSNEPRSTWRQALAMEPYDNKHRMRAAAARSTKYHWIYCDKPKAKSPEANEDKPWHRCFRAQMLDTQGVWSVSDKFLTSFWLISGPESNSHGDGRPQQQATP